MPAERLDDNLHRVVQLVDDEPVFKAARIHQHDVHGLAATHRQRLTEGTGQMQQRHEPVAQQQNLAARGQIDPFPDLAGWNADQFAHAQLRNRETLAAVGDESEMRSEGMMASVNGSLMRKQVPRLGTESISTLPPSRSRLVFTTSIPTPRPERDSPFPRSRRRAEI